MSTSDLVYSWALHSSAYSIYTPYFHFKVRYESGTYKICTAEITTIYVRMIAHTFKDFSFHMTIPSTSKNEMDSSGNIFFLFDMPF